MNISQQHRWIYSLALAGFLVLLVFVTKKSLPELASAGPERALASVDQTDPNLVGWWKFDEGSGSTAIDSSAKGHNGTMTGSPSYVTGAVGQYAINFNGTVQSVDAAPDASLAGASVFSVTFWAKPTAVANFGGNAAVSIHNGTLDASTFYIASTNTHGGTGPEVIWANGTLIKALDSSLTDGNFHFYTFVSRSATDHELFVDGASVGTSNASVVLPSVISNVTIGERYAGQGSHNGPIDDVRVYTRALSSTEVQQLYALGTGGSQTQQTQTGGTGGSSSDTTAPSTPTSLSATAVSSSQINLTWSASTDDTAVTGYKIYRGGTQIATSNTTSYSNTGLTASTQYSYTVAAYDAANNTSAQSSSVSATTQASSGSGSAVGGPGAGAHNIYVDQTLSTDCAGTYSAQNRNCSGTDGYAYTTLQKASDNSNPGNTIMIRGGTYQSACYGNQCYALQINQSGTSGNLITYEPYNGETVILSGLGFSDIDANGDGFADGPTDPGNRESTLELLGSYIHLTGLYITNSSGDGLEIDGSFDQIDNIHSHDNWYDGMSIGNMYTGKIQQDTLTNVASYHNRHDSGLTIDRWNDSTDGITDITITDSLFYENGRDASGREVLPIGGDPEGGGNSDGITVFKECMEAPGRTLTDICKNITVQGSVAYSNIDDGFDFSSSNSILKNDIAFNNGPTSSVGFKDFEVGHDIAYINDLSYHNLGRGFEIRESGGETLINNTSVENGTQSFYGAGGKVYNNIGYLGDQSGAIDARVADAIILSGCADCQGNMSTPNTSGAQLSGNPMFYNLKPFQDSSGNIVVNLPSGTVASQVAWIKDQFKNAFSLQPGSPAIDAGAPATYIDPTTGGGVALQYYGAAPDLGVYEYQVGQVITPLAPVVDQTPPANNPPPATNNPAPPAYVPPASTGGGGGGYSGGGGGGVTPASVAVSNVAVSGTLASGITVTWTTNGPSSSQILYGLTSAYGSQTAYDPSFVTSHSVRITGLLSNAAYHLQVRSKDAFGNLAMSPDITLAVSQNGNASVTVPASTVAPAQNPIFQPAPPNTVSQIGAVSGWFTIGTTDASVRTLQELLNAAGYAVAPAGSTGSSGHETTYFGPATESALERFQCAKLQVCSGDPATTGYGATGPRTRAALNAVGGASTAIIPVQAIPTTPTAVPATLTSSGSVTSWLVIGSTNSQVRSLQELLNAKGYTVSASGAGSPGNETSYFGPATQAALRKFQCAKLSVCAGDPVTTGYGATGPRTRAALSQ